MSTILFDKIVFGPVKSRRLGISLGVNLLPVNVKLCTFDCIYCECGLLSKGQTWKLPSRGEVKTALHQKLSEMKAEGVEPDVITFAGNGEPTLHPSFNKIIDDTIVLRNLFFPKAKISVLSNATMLHNSAVLEALNKVDNNIQKLDSGIESTMQLIDNPPNKNITVAKIVSSLKKFNGNFILQTMFLRGNVNGAPIDNTTEEEVTAWIKAVKETNPRQVMIYSLDREAPVKTLQKVEREELERIAEKVREEGFDVLVA
ncbi:MAG: radical SAM protein [Prevotellaceae bacterium]|jgi:wyosine [tRNA(Phe)-imidazoG37] synthetase (radical SAM superfamily)|nr:radical SAM protein [Prevotellaceae bacterium]